MVSNGRANSGFQGVYRVPPGGGQPQLLVDRNLFEQPNGFCFSPDERQLVRQRHGTRTDPGV